MNQRLVHSKDILLVNIRITYLLGKFNLTNWDAARNETTL